MANKSMDGKEQSSKNFNGKFCDTILPGTGIFSTAFMQDVVGCVVMDNKLKPLACNNKACELFGCGSQAELMENFSALMPQNQPDGRDSVAFYEEQIQKAVQYGSAEVDSVGQTLDGTQVSLHMTFVASGILQNDSDLIICYLQNRRHIIKADEEVVIKRVTEIVDAFPLCLNLWNHRVENIMCNNKAVELFGLKNKDEYCTEFFKLSPEYQPNGRLSAELAGEKIKQAFEHGYCQFYWLHCKLNGEEIPCEIILSKLQSEEIAEELVAGFTRDLRPQLAGESRQEEQLQEYFNNSISNKTLLRILTDMSEQWMYAYDLRTDVMRSFGKKSREMGIPAKSQNFIKDIIDGGLIHPDDTDVMFDIVARYKRGEDGENDIRIKDTHGEYHYYRMTDQAVLGKDSKPIFMVGRATDINDQKSLEQRARTDLLTNCLNKVSAENEIKRSIELSDENAVHAMLIIDIDDFKSINDNLGHHFGDLVLQEIAEKLKGCFRAHDVVGRLGGDEFIVFIKNVSDMKTIEQKAKTITEVFRNSYTGNENTYKVSGSVGVACYPEDAKTYEELYKAADQALYISKRQGKDCYTFYNKAQPNPTQAVMKKTALDNSKRNTSIFTDTDIVSTVFDLLYETNDLSSTVNIALRIIGMRLGVDRCSVFELNNEGTYDNTYEWCAPNVPSRIETLKDMPDKMWGSMFADADDDGIVFKDDLQGQEVSGVYEIIKASGIHAFLHAQIRKHGVVQCVIALDDCTGPRIWSDKEISIVSYLAKIVSTFLQNDKILKAKKGDEIVLSPW